MLCLGWIFCAVQFASGMSPKCSEGCGRGLISSVLLAPLICCISLKSIYEQKAEFCRVYVQSSALKSFTLFLQVTFLPQMSSVH